MALSMSGTRVAAGPRACPCKRSQPVQVVRQAPIHARSAFMGRPAHVMARFVAPQPRHAMQRPSARGAVVVEANLFSRLARVVKSYISNFTAQFEGM